MKRKKSKLINYPILDSWVKEFIKNEKFHDVMIMNPEESIEIFLQACSKLEFDSWVYADNEAFAKKLKSNSKSYRDLNNIFWEYHLHQIDAYQRFVVWRSEELIKSSVRLLNLKELNSSAVIARSCLELSVKCFVSNDLIKDELIELCKKDHNFSKEVVVSPKIEKFIWKAVFSDRNLWKNDDLFPKSIMNEINHIDKIYKKSSGKKFIRKLYGDLCEICHPNALGYLRYVEDNPEIDPHGFIKVKVSKKSTSGHWQKRVIKAILSSLSWSSEAMINSIAYCNEAKDIFSEKYLA